MLDIHSWPVNSKINQALNVVSIEVNKMVTSKDLAIVLMHTTASQKDKHLTYN